MSRRADLRELPIDLERRDDVPIHEALHDALRAAMLTGRLRPSARLPSSRDLALQLGVARGTVVALFEQLTSEGYLAVRAGSGTTVAESLPERRFAGGAAPLHAAPPRPERRPS